MAKNKLIDRVLKTSTLQHTSVLKESDFFGIKEYYPTAIPAINIALAGRLDGGLYQGYHCIAAPSKNFKTLFAMIMMKAYLDHDPNAIAIFIDSEFGAAKGYFTQLGIDESRVVHIPIHNIEELVWETVAQLEVIERGDKVFFMVDSLGGLASKREVENAKEQNEAKDMTRAQVMKSFSRIIPPYLNTRQIPMVAIHHTYKAQDGANPKYAETIMSGGQGNMLAANTVWFVSKSKVKEEKEVLGFNFTIKIEKSRYAREGATIPITVTFDGGIEKYSGLFDIALESGLIQVPATGWYSRMIGGKIEDRKWRRADSNTDEFWEPILGSQEFKDYISNNYLVSTNKLIQS